MLTAACIPVRHSADPSSGLTPAVSPPSSQMDSNEFFQHPAPLGDNLYDKTREKVQPPPRKGEWAGAAAAATAAAAGATQQQQAQEPSPAAAAASAAPATDAQGTSNSSSYLRKTMVSHATT